MGCPRTRGFVSHSLQLLGPERIRVVLATFDIFSALGTFEDARVMEPFCPTLGPLEGRGYVATSDFVTFFGEPGNARVT